MDPVTAMYVAQGIHGLAYGMVLFLVASGLTLIFGMMGILNLAHASFFMLSAYFSYTVLQLTGNFWLALLIAPAASAALGVLVERFLLRKVHAFGHIGELILTVGVSLVILDSVKAFWGTQNLPLAIPEMLQWLVRIGGLEYPLYRLFVIGLSLGVLAMFHAAGGAAGAFFGGVLFDAFQKYDFVWVAAISVAMIAGVLVLTIRENRPEPGQPVPAPAAA